MSTTKKYWKGLPELNQSEEFLKTQNNEFADAPSLDAVLGKESLTEGKTNRRDFLKFVGFTTAAAALASCEAPVQKAIPYVVKPEEVTPGVANFYASTFYDGHDYASILVKTREGRPIKIEGNELSKINNGGTNARTQASVLSLYDDARLKAPLVKGASQSWATVDGAIGTALKAASGQIAILTSSIISPSTNAVIAEFSAKYPNTKVVTYDSVSYSALANANEKVFGKRAVSSYDFSKANVIVGLACDFLGTWLSPTEFAGQYAKTRKVSKDKTEMSKHYHFEANMSLTGANADERFMVKPSEIGKVAVMLYNEVAKLTNNAAVGAATIGNAEATKRISKIAAELKENAGESLVVCGLNDTNTQVIINGINKMLSNYGKTVDSDITMNTKKGNDAEVKTLIEDMKAGKVGAVMFYNTNPAYTLPKSAGFEAALKSVPVKVSFSLYNDETAQLCDYVCPDNHYLESWGDANPKRGHYSLQQPTIPQLFSDKTGYAGTRQVQDTLLKWAGVKSDYLTYLQAYWQNHIFSMQGKYGNFFDFWSNTLHDGVLKVNVSNKPEMVIAPMAKDSAGRPIMAGVAAVVNAIADSVVVPVKEEVAPVAEVANVTLPTVDYAAHAAKAASIKANGAFEVTVYEKIGLGNGNQANNPWLQELPDPISKVTWDNYITMSLDDITKGNFKGLLRQDIIGSVATISVNGETYTLPVYPQPGQAPGTVGVALGYGRTAKDFKVAEGVGQNAFKFLTWNDDSNTYLNIGGATVAKVDETHEFAATQIHHTIMGREEFILRETSIEQYKKGLSSEEELEKWNPKAEIHTNVGAKPIAAADLWAEHSRPGHKWAMNIDLNSCIGCGACVVACTSENNVAVVGKDQVKRTREMHWLRIDRYYTSNMTRVKADKDHVGAMDMYLQMENPSENPQVTFQPIMCQHCNHAPCETVCPVLATNHSSEGINQMTYNRCIGTRYCANNCPFKVRRFNWYNYNENPDFAMNPAQSDFGRMVLNPDVVVRGRGVMEKCSMCAQRTQAGKLVAKKAGAPLVDGSIKTACQQSCPTNAITFGDANDENSEISKIRMDERNYFLLEELGVKPTVSYMVKVRNQEEEIVWEAEHHAAAGHGEEKHENHGTEEKKEEAKH